MLLSSDATAAAIEVCGAEDFYKPAHGHIFGAVVALFERGEAIDAVTVLDELTRSGLLDSVGDPAVLVSLQANTPSIANAVHYARIVEEHALLRRMIGVAGEIADIGYSVPEDVEGAIDEVEAMVFDVAQRRTTESIQSLHDVLLPGARPDRGAVPRPGRDRPGWPPATPTSTRSWPACSPRASPSSAPARPWARRASPSGCWPTSASSCAAEPAVLLGDGPPRALPAPAGLRGPGRRPAGPHRPAARVGLAEGGRRRQPSRQRPDLHRRQPEPDGHGHPGPGPAPPQERGRPRAW